MVTGSNFIEVRNINDPFNIIYSGTTPEPIQQSVLVNENTAILQSVSDVLYEIDP